MGRKPSNTHNVAHISATDNTLNEQIHVFKNAGSAKPLDLKVVSSKLFVQGTMSLYGKVQFPVILVKAKPVWIFLKCKVIRNSLSKTKYSQQQAVLESDKQ